MVATNDAYFCIGLETGLTKYRDKSHLILAFSETEKVLLERLNRSQVTFSLYVLKYGFGKITFYKKRQEDWNRERGRWLKDKDIEPMTWRKLNDLETMSGYFRKNILYEALSQWNGIKWNEREQGYIQVSCVGYLSSNFSDCSLFVIGISYSLIMYFKRDCQGHCPCAKFRLDMLISALPPNSINSFFWTSCHKLEIKKEVVR